MSRRITVNLKGMTSGELREYRRLAARKKHAKVVAARPYKEPRDVGDMRRCTKCAVSKPRNAEKFYLSKEGRKGFNARCIVCSRKHSAEYQKKRLFNMTLDQYMRATAGVCEICGCNSRRCVDHCHETGNVRGVLCSKCNTGMGQFEDNPELLEAAAAYLRKYGYHRSGPRKSVQKRRAAWGAMREALQA